MLEPNRCTPAGCCRDFRGFFVDLSEVQQKRNPLTLMPLAFTQNAKKQLNSWQSQGKQRRKRRLGNLADKIWVRNAERVGIIITERV